LLAFRVCSMRRALFGSQPATCSERETQAGMLLFFLLLVELHRVEWIARLRFRRLGLRWFGRLRRHDDGRGLLSVLVLCWRWRQWLGAGAPLAGHRRGRGRSRRERLAGCEARPLLEMLVGRRLPVAQRWAGAVAVNVDRPRQDRTRRRLLAIEKCAHGGEI